MKDLPIIIQIVLAIGVPTALVIIGRLIWWVTSGKGSIDTPWAKLKGTAESHEAAQVQAAGNESDVTAARIQCMMDRLPLIREAKWSSYLSLLKQRGIQAVNFVNNEDAQFYYECLGNVVWSGNGIKSYMSIIQRCLIERHYERFDSEVEFEAFIDDVMARLRENENRYLDSRYLTMVTTADGATRKRVIDRDSLYKLTEVQREETRKHVRDIFVQAREAGCA